MTTRSTQALAALAIPLVLVAGIWVAGGKVTDHFTASMALTAAWIAGVGLACLAVARGRRGLRVPLIGAYLLTLTEFGVDNGPDLRIRLVAEGGGARDFHDLGALKGNRGDQQHAIPSDVELGRYSTAVVWCRAFSVAFAGAPLRLA